MNINLNKNEDKLIISLEGRLDTTTSPELESEYKKLDEKNIVLDLKDLKCFLCCYYSILKAFLQIHQQICKQQNV